MQSTVSKDDLFNVKRTRVLRDHDPHFGLKILQAKKRSLFLTYPAQERSVAFINDTTLTGEIRAGQVQHGFLKSPLAFKSSIVQF